MFRTLMASWLLVAALPAAAMTIENASADQVRLSIDKWTRFVDAGAGVEFLSATLPIAVYAQYPQASVVCEVASQEAQVRLSEEGCWIDGALAAEPRFRF